MLNENDSLNLNNDRVIHLTKHASRIFYVRNLSQTMDGADLYDLFGIYGAIRQIRIGNTEKTKITVYVVFEDVFNAKIAKDKLNGSFIGSRYLIVQYHQLEKIRS